MEFMSKHFMADGCDELVLKRDDWSVHQWQAFLDIFGLKEAEQIKITEYKLEVG